MEIEKEQNIVVRYIPQYIVIETRYQSLSNDQQQISKTTSRTRYGCDEKFELENSIQDVAFGHCDAIEYAEDHDESAELKQIETFDAKSVDIIESKLSPGKRKYNSKAAKLLNEWFLSHLHV